MTTEIEAAHLTVGARGRERLVIDDRDRFAIVERLRAAHGRALLGWCLMTTHLHVIVEGPGEHHARWLAERMRGYVRRFNARWNGTGDLLRGPVDVRSITTLDQLHRTIRYDHRNPCRTEPPMVENPVEYEWSGAREHAGLSLAGVASAERLGDLLGRRLDSVIGWWPALSDAEPRRVPTASPTLLLGAAAQARGIPVDAVAGAGRTAEVLAARLLYVRLGCLEGYDQAQLAPTIERSPAQVCRLAAASADVPDLAVRIARTLLREPTLRRRIPRPARADGAPADAIPACI